MSTDAASSPERLSHFEQLRYAREILQIEGRMLFELAERLARPFCQAVDEVLRCRGNVIVTGMGKAGLIGRKIVATLASTGSCSHFVHPGEAVHGDLGRIHALDLVLALSFSGETEEVVRLLPSLREMNVPLLAITSSAQNTLGRAAHIVLEIGEVREACCLGLAPSTSTTAMLALGDALALVASRSRQFCREDFARYHPGGSLGRKLARVSELMRPLRECRVAAQSQTVRQVIVQVSRPGRRTGAIMLVDTRGKLTGLFTDSDLARILEDKQDAALDLPIQQIMTRAPTTVTMETRLTQAVDLLAARKISELPVVDSNQLPIGILDITDIVGLDSQIQAPENGTPENGQPDRNPDWRAKTVPIFKL